MKKQIREAIRNIIFEPAPIIREVVVKGKKLKAEYDPKEGYFRFTNADGEPYELTNVGAFSTINAVLDSFKDIDMDKILYETKDSDEHRETRQKLYSRALTSRGYEQVGKPKKYLFGSTYFSLWRKKRDKKPSWLEKSVGFASVTSLILGIVIMSPNLTGNAIANISTQTTSFLGVGLLIVGLVMGFFWVKK
jgi:hypothetical protein